MLFSIYNCLERYNNISVFHPVFQRYRVTAALESDGIDIHHHITAFAHYLTVPFKISGVAADTASVQSHAVGSRSRLFNSDPANITAVRNIVLESVKMSILQLVYRDKDLLAHDLILLRQTQFNHTVVIRFYSGKIDDRNRCAGNHRNR